MEVKMQRFDAFISYTHKADAALAKARGMNVRLVVVGSSLHSRLR